MHPAALAEQRGPLRRRRSASLPPLLPKPRPATPGLSDRWEAWFANKSPPGASPSRPRPRVAGKSEASAPTFLLAPRPRSPSRTGRSAPPGSCCRAGDARCHFPSSPRAAPCPPPRPAVPRPPAPRCALPAGSRQGRASARPPLTPAWPGAEGRPAAPARLGTALPRRGARRPAARSARQWSRATCPNRLPARRRRCRWSCWTTPCPRRGQRRYRGDRRARPGAAAGSGAGGGGAGPGSERFALRQRAAGWERRGGERRGCRSCRSFNFGSPPSEKFEGSPEAPETPVLPHPEM